MSHVSPLLHKKGHVEFKTAFCTECGDKFEYPKHFTQKPTYCEAHDPNPNIEIDLSEFEGGRYEQAAVNSGDGYEVREVDGAFYHVSKSEPGWDYSRTVNVSGLQAVPGNATLYYQTIEPVKPELGALSFPNGSYVLDGTSGYMQVEVDGKPAGMIWHERPQGTSFADSRRMRSIEQIRAEYESRLAEVQQPSVVDIVLPAPRRGKHITIIHAGDVHIGTDACTYSAFKELLAYVLATPDVYIAFQGDLVDLLTAHSVGVMAEQAMTIQDQFNIATADLLPLARAGKILWLIKGNHEDRLDRATKNIVDGAQWMARILDVNYLYTEGYTRVHCGGVNYLSYNLHGFNAGSSAGARRNKMDSMLGKFPSADVITCGHNHQLDVIPRVDDMILPDNKRAHKARYGIYTGTYHSYIGYPAETGMGAGPLGCVAVHFDIEYGIVKPEVLPVIPVAGRYRHVLPAR